MNFERYLAKLQDYQIVFIMLCFIPSFKEKLSPEKFKKIRDIISDSVRDLIKDTPKSKAIPTDPLPLHVELLSMVKNVNLAADQDTLEQQAEAVKAEIIRIGQGFTSIQHLKKKKHLLSINDFIRNKKNGQIIYPFDYWYDCVDVYLQKELFNKSNGQIAKKTVFKSSNSSDPSNRSPQRIVAKMLSEIDLLKEATLQQNFPPQTMTGTKQPTMAN